MTTQSKSQKNPLLFIIIIAVILFIASVLWKYTHTDNSEEINIPDITKVDPIKTKKPKIIEDTINVDRSSNPIDDAHHCSKLPPIDARP